MTDKRKRYSAEFKSKVALEAIREVQTIQALAQKYGVHPTQINKWKKEVVEGVSALFKSGASPKEAGESKEIAHLERKVGQLVVENDFLRKNWEGWTLRNGGK